MMTEIENEANLAILWAKVPLKARKASMIVGGKWGEVTRLEIEEPGGQNPR